MYTVSMFETTIVWYKLLHMVQKLLIIIYTLFYVLILHFINIYLDSVEIQIKVFLKLFLT